MPRKPFVALVGPSGSGKSAIIRFLTAFYPDEFAVPRSATSRPRREGEGDGEYRFLSEDEFDRLVEEDAFLEHSTYAGHRYGILKSAVEEIAASGRTAIRAMDFPGAMNAGAFAVFVDRPTDGLLASILSRDVTDAEIVRRIRQIPEEKANRPKCHAAVRNDGRLRDAAHRVRFITSGELDDVVPGVLVGVGPDGAEVRIPCSVDLNEDYIWPNPDWRDAFLMLNGAVETLLIRNLPFQIRRPDRIEAADAIEFVGKSPDFP